MRRLRHAFVLLALFAVPAAATQVQHLDTRDLTQTSSDIVVGRVQDVKPHWNADHTKIFTDVTVQVSQTLKGVSTPAVTLTQLGGTVGDLRYEVEGCPAFAPGEEALLFLWRDSKGRAQLNGLGQGKFEITRDAKTGARMVQRRVEGLAIGDTKRLGAVATGRPAPPLPLDDLITEIKATLAEGGR
jgi:hypothetical protein